MGDPQVFEVGSVVPMDGTAIRVGVSHDAVWVVGSGGLLNRQQAETFAQLYVRACWLAGQQDT